MPQPQLKNAVGPVIRKLRNQQGWTQEELAAKLQLKGWDCTRSWLAKIEAQQVYVKDFELLYFCAVFGKHLDDLYSSLSALKADPRQRATNHP
jgi:transcriptional regulator with XRE-family HTH domain